MALSRRSILITGGALAGAFAVGGAYFFTRTPTAALRPWQAAGDPVEPRLKALSYAILAPNPHNRQPWLIELAGEDRVRLFCQLERRLPETDPFDRQITIGMGCFLEMLRLAAAAQGWRLEIAAFPEGEPAPRLDERPVADIRFVRDIGVRPDPLFAHALARRSLKENFDTARPVAPGLLAELLGQAATPVRAGGSVATDDVAVLRALTWQAHERETRTHRTNMESVRLMRIGKREIEANPDGIDLGGAFLETLNRLGMLDREQLADPDSQAFRQGHEMYREMLGSAMGHVWLITPGNSRGEQLASGAAWLRVNLAATGLGLGLHPLSQALQEFPEMADLHADVHARLAPDGGRVQMLGRIGYGPAVNASPRWPLESRVRSA